MKFFLFLTFWLFAAGSPAQPVLVFHQATNQNILSPGATAYALGQFDDVALATADVTEPYPYELSGCRVQVNGIPAQVRFVSDRKISFVTPPAKLRRYGHVSIVITTPRGAFESSATLEMIAPGILTMPETDSMPVGLFATPKTRMRVIGEEPVPLSQPGLATNVMLLLTGSRFPVGPSRFGPHRFPDPFRAFEIIVRVRIGDEFETVGLLYPWLGLVDSEACYFDLPENLPQVGKLPVTVIVGGVASNVANIEFRRP